MNVISVGGKRHGASMCDIEGSTIADDHMS
jgi:hypothetical protein